MLGVAYCTTMSSKVQDDWKNKAPPVVARIEKGEKMPFTVIMVGMAGSGKTSLMAQLQASLEEAEEGSKEKHQQHAYCVNLDPATLNVPYDVSIDIRDTVNYKQVMKTHKLGPNGAIMVSGFRARKTSSQTLCPAIFPFL